MPSKLLIGMAGGLLALALVMIGLVAVAMGGWLSPQSVSPSGSQASVAVDVNGVVHVVYKYSNYIFYKNNSSGDWPSVPDTVATNASSSGDAHPSIAVQGSTIHIVWRGSDAKIYYAQKIEGGDFFPSDIVSGSLTSNNYPCVAVDSDEVPHVVWYNSGNQNIYYNCKSGGTWGGVETLDTGDNGSPSIAVKGTDVYVAWHKKITNSGTSLYNIVYTKKTGNIWEKPQNVSSTSDGLEEKFPSLSVDSNSKVHIACYRDGGIIYYQQVGGSFSSEEVIPSGADDRKPSLALDPNNKAHIAWVTSDNTKVLYSNNTSDSFFSPPDEIASYSGSTYITEVDRGIGLCNPSNKVWVVFWHDGIKASYTSDYSLPVLLASFTASASEKGIILRWRTESEMDILGFRVLRAESREGPYEDISGLVPTSGGISSGQEYSFMDARVEEGQKYWYCLEEVGRDGDGKILRTISQEVGRLGKSLVPTELLPASPNPFNPGVLLRFRLSREDGAGRVHLGVYDITGRLVREWTWSSPGPGLREVKWDGWDVRGHKVGSGTYIVRLSTENGGTLTQKIARLQ